MFYRMLAQTKHPKKISDPTPRVGDVIIGIARPAVASARVPSGAPDLQAHHGGQFVVQHFGIGDLASVCWQIPKKKTELFHVNYWGLVKKTW